MNDKAMDLANWYLYLSMEEENSILSALYYRLFLKYHSEVFSS